MIAQARAEKIIFTSRASNFPPVFAARIEGCRRAPDVAR
jgi:hypothetical protein